MCRTLLLAIATVHVTCELLRAATTCHHQQESISGRSVAGIEAELYWKTITKGVPVVAQACRVIDLHVLAACC